MNPAEKAKRSREDELVNLRKDNAQLQLRVNVSFAFFCITNEIVFFYSGNRNFCDYFFVVAGYFVFQILQDRLTRLYESRSQSGVLYPGAVSGDVTMEVAESLKDHPDPIGEVQSESPTC